MATFFENTIRPYALFGVEDGLPYGSLRTYGKGGPALCSVDGWSASTATSPQH